MKLFIVSIILLFSSNSVYASESSVVINEFVVDSDTEWVELYIEGEDIDFIKEYWIDDDKDFEDDSGSGKKKLLQKINLESKPFVTIEFKSFLNNSGDSVVLFDNEGNILDQFDYSSNPGKDISIGRWPDRSGSFGILSESTKGLANAIIAIPTPTITPTPTRTPTPTKIPTPTKTPEPTKTPKPTKAPTPTKKKDSSKSTAINSSSNNKISLKPSRRLLGAKTKATSSAIFSNYNQIESSDSAVSTHSASISSTNKKLRLVFLTLGGICMVGMVISSYIVSAHANQSVRQKRGGA